MTTRVLNNLQFSSPLSPYVSVHGNDLELERAFLAEQVFPKLERSFLEQGKSFQPLLLDWPQERRHNTECDTQKFALCLNSIMRCAPHFLCILAEDYGGIIRESDGDSEAAVLIRQNVAHACREGFTWVNVSESEQMSLTELEIMQACYRNKSEQCYFYFRDDRPLDHDDDGEEEEMIALPPDDPRRKMRQLKRQIVDSEFPVSNFRTLEQLGERVSIDMMCLLESTFPNIPTRISTSTHAMITYEERTLQEWFAHERSAAHFETRESRAAFERMSGTAMMGFTKDGANVWQILDTRGHVHAVTGQLGSGKSSLLASFYSFLRAQKLSVPVIYYSTSASTNTSLLHFLKYTTQSLREWYVKDSLHYADLARVSEARDVVAHVSSFHTSLKLGPCILLIDGVENFYTQDSKQNDTTDEPAIIRLLPAHLPDGCQVFLTVEDTHSVCQQITSHHDQVVSYPFQQTLDEKQGEEFATSFLKTNCPSIVTPPHRVSFSGLKLANRVDILVALMSKLVSFNRIIEISTLIETHAHVTCIGDIWKHLIARWVVTFGWLKAKSPSSKRSSAASEKGAAKSANVSDKEKSTSGWVADTLRLFACSRDGLRVGEVLHALKFLGYTGSLMVRSSDLHLFLTAARFALLQRPDGTIVFCHRTLRGAVESELLAGLTHPNYTRPVSALRQPWETCRARMHTALYEVFTKHEPATVRTLAERVHQTHMLGDSHALKDIITEPCVFSRLITALPECSEHGLITKYLDFLIDSGIPLEDVMSYMHEKLRRRVQLSRNDEANEAIDVNEANDVDDSNEANDANGVNDADETDGVNDPDEEVVEEIEEERSHISEQLFVLTNESVLNDTQFGYLLYHMGRILCDYDHLSLGLATLLQAHHHTYISSTPADQDLVCRIELKLSETYLEQDRTGEARDFAEKAERSAATVDEDQHISQNCLAYLRGRIFEQRALVELHAMTEITEAANSMHLLLSDPTSAGSYAASVSAGGSRRGISSAASRRTGGPRDERISNRVKLNPVSVQAAEGMMERARREFTIAHSVIGESLVSYHQCLLSRLLGDNISSRAHIERAMEKWSQWYGGTHHLMAEGYHQLGLIVRGSRVADGDDERAESYFQRALSIRRVCLARDDPRVIATLTQLGALLQERGRRDTKREAGQLFEEALDLSTMRRGFYHPLTVLIRRSLHALQRKDGDTEVSSVTSSPVVEQLRSLSTSAIERAASKTLYF